MYGFLTKLLRYFIIYLVIGVVVGILMQMVYFPLRHGGFVFTYFDAPQLIAYAFTWPYFLIFAVLGLF